MCKVLLKIPHNKIYKTKKSFYFFSQVVLAFFHQVPQAILRSIIAHMKLTDPVELDSLVASNRQEFGSSNPSQNDKNVNLQRRKTIPLTPARVEFLMGLLAPVLKQV